MVFRKSRFSALQRAEIAEIRVPSSACRRAVVVSVLFNEPKLLKCSALPMVICNVSSFSALQRAEIAEMPSVRSEVEPGVGRFSALQRAEIAEIASPSTFKRRRIRFSALQRAEIAEIHPYQKPRSCEQKFQCSSTSRNC